MCMCMFADSRAVKGQALRGGRCLELPCAALVLSVGGAFQEGGLGTCPHRLSYCMVLFRGSPE